MAHARPLPIMPILMRPLWLLLVLLLLGWLTGCGRQVPPIPESARHQQPQAGLSCAWRGDGRLEIAVPTGLVSVRCLLRGGPSTVRMILLEDTGVVLADLEADPSRYVIHQVVDRLAERSALLAELPRQAFLPPPAPERSTWDDGRLIHHHQGTDRWYGGDPVLLRRSENDGRWPVVISDWRLRQGRLVPHAVHLEGPLGITIALRLRDWQELPPAP